MKLLLKHKALAKLSILTTFFLLLGIFLSVASAANWEYEKKSIDQTSIFGDMRIILTTDASRNQVFPEFTLKIFSGSVLQAQYRNIAYDRIFASDDNSVFVGLSNDGLPGTAIVVFDKRGNLRLELKHRFANFPYCQLAGIRQRQWYDNENPAFEFIFDSTGKKLQDMLVNDCNGKRVSLFTLIEQTYRKPLNPEKKNTPDKPGSDKE